jgi:hypothetical protein
MSVYFFLLIQWEFDDKKFPLGWQGESQIITDFPSAGWVNWADYSIFSQ